MWISSPEKLYLHIPALHEFIGISIPLEYNIPIKIVLSVIVPILVLLIQLLRDYGKFIPKSWSVRVYFDEEGLESMVRSYSDEERKKLRIPDDWQKHSIKFINHMNGQLEKYDAPKIAKFGPNTVGIGNFEYQYHKVPGRQRYHLEDGKGFIKFEFDSREGTTTLLVEFIQKQRGADWVEPSIADLLYRFNTVVAPTFSHIVTLVHPTDRHRLAEIKAPTRIRFFPSVDVGRTLYLTDIRELRSTMSGIPENMIEYMIPYGYGVNRFQHH